MPLFSFEEPEPKLNPPISCWREDMPENHEPQLVPPQLRWLTTLNDTFLEIPRYSTQVSWGGVLAWAILVFTLGISWFLFGFVMQEVIDGYGMVAMGFGGAFIFFAMALSGMKMYFVQPRDQPLRLNRKRQKIYIYEYKRRFFPWIKWPVTIRSYNWADVHGEIRYSSARYDSGYQLFGSVCEPGTNNVIARFIIAKDSRERSSREQLCQIWSYLCVYMQHDQVVAEPDSPGRPDDWRPRKADQWPAEMELESTTAP
ncbi:DUF6708 domain-containing protein [Rahnella inusitata]|uniref:DUF6708 domain-containing protein n=1 Tax=Rahnella inusitata TaxID=58169 RepID=A0ABX9NW07_9GAMM|nr:DUF6708 domain-containing protein [Rahnella inusitata]RJT09556.1 hypothetical protein D5396_20885 [Rahnella inusitata]